MNIYKMCNIITIQFNEIESHTLIYWLHK